MPKLTLDTNIVFIDIDVVDIEKALLLYDSIQVWRSPDNIVDYAEISSQFDEPAIVDGTIDGTWNLSGKTLTIVKNSADPVSLVFTGTDPFDLLSIIKQINIKWPNIASQLGPNINKIRITSDVEGLNSNLTITGNAGATLGLSTTKAIGKTHRPDLTYPTIKYRFYDLDGSTTYYYKVRFFNHKNGTASAFSPIIRATPLQVLNNSDMVVGSITLSDHVGMPIEGRRIIIVPISTRRVNSAALLSTQDRIIIKTNQFGYASTKLPKGSKVKVFFEGTGFEREILVPDADFDILAAATTYPDPFSIVTTPPLAIRTS